VHAAGVLSDAFMVNMQPGAIEAAMGPKAGGAWNLHVASEGSELDFFVLFSSGVSVLGSPGQANYVAANAFLDALAHMRRSEGLAAQSINWGAWAEIGLAADAGRNGATVVDELGTIAPAAGVQAFERLLSDEAAQVAVLPTDWARLPALFPALARTPLLRDLVPTGAEAGGAEGDSALRAAVQAVTGEERERLLVEFLTDEIAKVLQIDPELLDPAQQLNRVGLDSLMALELKNRVETALVVTLPVVGLVEGPSIAKLAGQLAGLVDEAGGGEDSEAISAERAAELLETIDDLSDEEVDSLLAEMSTTGSGDDA
jgi:acyl carrier protein